MLGLLSERGDRRTIPTKLTTIGDLPEAARCVRQAQTLRSFQPNCHGNDRHFRGYQVLREPMTGFEPVTSSLPRKCSTTELHWQKNSGFNRHLRKKTLGNRAEDEAQTRDPQLGRLMLYQLSYFRILRTLATSARKPGNAKGKYCGRGWIRTTEGIASRFTVCPIWPLWNTPL